jgi:hypothetical protein
LTAVHAVPVTAQGDREARWSQWRDQAVAGDAQAAFELGKAHVLIHIDRYHLAAQGWFNRAAYLGGTDMLWQVTCFYTDETGYAAMAGQWMRRAVSAEWDGCEVEVAPEAFGILGADPDGDGVTVQEWSVTVSSEPRPSAAAALHACRDRIYLVRADGYELTTEEEIEESDDNDLDSPNYIGVDVNEDGTVVLWIDYKDTVRPLTARTHLRIIVEELRAAGVIHARIGSPEPQLHARILRPPP